MVELTNKKIADIGYDQIRIVTRKNENNEVKSLSKVKDEEHKNEKLGVNEENSLSHPELIF